MEEAIMEKTVLDEYLGQSGDMPVTIANLENLLADNDLCNALSLEGLFNARRALISLTFLQEVINS